MAAEPAPVRFGIVGCAGTVWKMSRAFMMSPNSTIVAIGSRTLEKAVMFAKYNELPASAKTYGSYDAVLDDPDVDAVYMPLPTSLHLKWAVLAARKKKHLLLEKPVALNVKDLDEILEACESSGVQFMDATMWLHHPRTAQMKDFLSDSQRFGQLKSIHTIFSYNYGPDFLEHNIRVKPDLDSLGAFGDVGWYCIGVTLWANDFQLPKTVIALRNTEFNEAGVNISCGACLYFDEGKSATFYGSFLGNLTMELSILGSNGFLRSHDFVIPFEGKSAEFYVNSGTTFTERALGIAPSPTGCTVETELPQEVLMVKEFSSLVGKIRDHGSGTDKYWATISRKTQVVVDALMDSVKNGFDPVEVVY